ncbi:MAG: RagB/SusD family nutrient uptake outer membrane protein [Tannerellaceae bacterium]|nr:RagB/SusD family nutrient uptake outer membrane protein [Tannerellaceae bacterium]
MIRKILYIIITGLCLTLNSCINDFLDRKPLDVISDKDVWGNESAILAYLANMYDNVQVEPHAWLTASEGFLSHYTDESLRAYTWGIPYNPTFPDSYLANWEYGKVRVINEFIEKIATTSVSQSVKDRYLAEAYFIRAFNYFVMAKRYGGVPLVKEAQKYEGVSIDDLKVSRSTEEETWNFIAEDLDKAIAGLPEDLSGSEQYRASKYAAYALKSRAMLYAASIARYGNVQLNGLVGIPADRASDYFNRSLAASEAIINSGKYSLYDKNPNDRAANFQNLFVDRTMHEEAIFSKAYSADKGHSFDYYTAPESFKVSYGDGIGPTLEFVEAFEYTDGRPGTLTTDDANGNPIYYDLPEDIFEGKDPRFFASVMYPNCPWQGGNVVIRRGIIGSDGVKVPAAAYSDRFPEDPSYTLAGKDGMPIQGDATRTGFLLKKYLDPVNLRLAGNRSTTNFLVFRYAETLLNYAEAAIELNRPNDALPKLNAVRSRAGIQFKASVTLDDVRKERKVELAFENLRYWDLVRWRIATQVMNNTVFGALLPWLDYKTGKYVFEKAPNTLNSAKTFLERNYYQPIPNVDQNDALIQNPGF